ncbi:MAG: Ig-like domain repeat protein [Lachnospiraceae bacterium]|nr:Ig-like domain repeat protein [Lachnospiraceae bacterium]
MEEGQTVYNGDVDVRVTGMEDSGSGIQKVLYKILKDSEGVDQGEIIGEDKYDYENGVTDFENSTFTIKIPAEGNNSSSIRVQVRVVDNAGNMQERKIAHLAINNQIPKVKLSIVSKEHEEAKKTYYNQDCIIKIEVDDADYTLNRKAFEQAIQIEKDGNKIELSEMANYGEWKWVERDKSESGLPYIQLSFRENAQYRLSLGQYKNLANQVAVVEGMNNYEFTVDKTKPNGKLVEADSGDISMQPADSLADLLAIALIKRQPVIYVESPDGDVAKILYYKQKYIENTRPLSENDLEKLYVKGEFEKPEDNFISINSNEEFVVYVRITDNAGNTTYLNSNGIIVDILGGKVTITESGVNGSSKSEAGYYNGDVKITITVNDEGMNDIFSGIRKVTAFVYCDGVLKHPVTKEATGIELFAFDKDKNNDGKLEGTVKKEDLITSKIFTAFKLDGITHEFILKGEDYNSDNVRVEVCVKDNAGNPFDDGDGIWAERDKLELKINTTKPTVTVDFGNDITPEIRVEEDIDGKQRGYFQSEKASEAAKEKKATRVAKITITDRASTFDKDNATKEIKKQISAMIYDNDELKTNVELKKLNIDWDSEGDIHTAYVYFVDDGNYNCTWDALGYTNKADNKPGSIVVNGNEPRDVQVAYTFTIDNTLPTGLLKINDTTEIGRWTKAEEETDTEQDKINFFFRNKEIKVTIGGDDAVSPYELYYYQEKAELSTPLSITELNKKFNASAFTKYEHKLLKPDIDTSFNGTAFSVGSLFEGVGYLRVEDYAGNYIYISSEGYVVEDTAPVLTLQPSTPDVLVDGKNINPDPNNPKKFGYYNGDKKLIEVKVNVADLINQVDAYSGIKSVSYTIKKDNDTKITDEGILFPLEGNLPDRMAYDQRKEVFDAIITIDDIGENGRHNSSDLKVEVTAVDNAGNTVTDYVVLDIDTSRPTILVSYDNNNDNGTGSYFDKPRQAIVKVTERKGSFNAQEATAGITIKAVDANGNDIKNPDGTIWDTKTLIGPWQEEEGTDKTGEADRYTQYTTINFIEDATYTLHIEYTDNSGNINQGFSYAPGTIHPEKFTIDKTNPTGTLTATGMNEKSKNSSWNQMVDSLTFDRWSINGITVNGTFEDITSSIQQVDYYKVANNKVLTKEELEWELGDTSVVHTQVQQIPLWQPLILQETNIRSTRTGSIGAITPDEQFTVYMRLKDKAGNTSYISTDGMIVDATAPVVINLIPEGESHAGMEGDLYSGDVNVAVIVEDPITQGDTYSGIDSIEYTISSLGTVTDSNRIEFNQDNRTKGDLQQKYEGSILVDSEQNNSNEVLVEVVVTDNAGNQTKEQLELQIDVTPPEIMISYDNNAPDSDSYYKETRVATISVSERNFDPELVLVDITNTDGPIPVLSNWTESGGGGNGDDTVHSATISYEEDGDYTFEVECTDMADNQAEEITFEPGTVNEKEFTIDQTLPEISVSYDNNDVYNEKYFKEGRVATVTIREHNFVRDRVEFTQTANRGASIPGVSWSSNGDTHTATIPYNSDGDYTFEVTMQDMAGNESEEADYGGSAAGKDFIVDTEISELEITGVENGKAYKDEVVPAVRFSDANFGDYEIKLTRTRRDEIDKDVTEQFIQGMTITGSGGYGTFDTFAEIPENDGIYTLYAKMVDLAGNELEETVTFIINRFGSLYVYSDYLISLIQNGGAYVQEVEEDLVITEYNADRLVAGSLQIEITRDGRPLEEVVYTSSVVYESESGNDEFVAPNGWSQYRYEIAKENFAADGVYKMEVSSKDASGNNPENTNYEDKGILFRVDSTAPELTSVVGLEETIVNANKLDVSYEIYDTIGLKSMKVYVDGKLYGEEITQFEDLSNYAGMFTLNESRAEQSVRLVIEDLAGNITDTDAADFTSVYAFQKKVTISTNALIRLLADRNMLTGVIIAGVAAVIGFWFIMFWKRRKKDEEEVGNAK